MEGDSILKASIRRIKGVGLECIWEGIRCR